MYEVKVEGMSCGGCVNSIANALRSLDPQAQVSVDLKTQLVKIQSAKDKSEITATIEDAGYTVVEVKRV
jgi:copper chaperone